MNTPVSLIIFNRPDKTQKVFDEIAKAKPKKLFVIADGPRDECPDDKEKCAAARKVIEQVDWDCEVFKNYSDVNLGCGKRPATGISWVFENVEEAIIFEDDCIPNQTFFRFCDEILERYRDDQRVMVINGMNTVAGQKEIPYSYCFRYLMKCAGAWATWRRAWQYHDLGIKMWPKVRDSSWLFDFLIYPTAVEQFKNVFEKTYTMGGNVDYWDYQWCLCCWLQNGLVVVPETNLVKNIGYGDDATHTKSVKNHEVDANLLVKDLAFPLRHPPYMVRDREADLLRLEYRISRKKKRNSMFRRVRRKISSLLK